MDEKKKVYVETSVISNLTARPSHDIFDLARQMDCRDHAEDLRNMSDGGIQMPCHLHSRTVVRGG